MARRWMWSLLLVDCIFLFSSGMFLYLSIFSRTAIYGTIFSMIFDVWICLGQCRMVRSCCNVPYCLQSFSLGSVKSHAKSRFSLAKRATRMVIWTQYKGSPIKTNFSTARGGVWVNNGVRHKLFGVWAADHRPSWGRPVLGCIAMTRGSTESVCRNLQDKYRSADFGFRLLRWLYLIKTRSGN